MDYETSLLPKVFPSYIYLNVDKLINIFYALAKV